MHSSTMISPAKRTPLTVERYLETKIKMLDNGVIKSSPEAQYKICQFRRHDKGKCPACSPLKEKETADNDSHSKKYHDSDSDD